MNLENSKTFGQRRTILLIGAVFIFLFFGSEILAVECLPFDSWNLNGCTVSVTYTDQGGSNLNECRYKIVLEGVLPGTSYASWPLAGNCYNRETISLNVAMTVESKGTYDLYWYSKDNAGNENTGKTDGKKNICVDCLIDGGCYDKDTCKTNEKCQICDPDQSQTSWSPVPLGFVCNISNKKTPVSSSDYCNYDETCDAGDCAAKKFWTSCDGNGFCQASFDHEGSYSEDVYANVGYTLTGDCGQSTVDCLAGLCRDDSGWHHICDKRCDTGHICNYWVDCVDHCENGIQDCNETGQDTGGSCPAAAFDFSISIDPTAGSIIQGNSISTNVMVNLLSAVTEAVIFSASGLPANATLSFNPGSCNPTCSGIMTISTALTTPTGNFPIIVCGHNSDGLVTRCYSSYSLTVTAATEEVLSPSVTTGNAVSVTKNSAVINGTLNSLGNTDSCLVWFEWGTTPSYGNITSYQTMTAPGAFSAVLTGLDPNTNYYFQAKAKNGGSY